MQTWQTQQTLPSLPQVSILQRAGTELRLSDNPAFFLVGPQGYRVRTPTLITNVSVLTDHLLSLGVGLDSEKQAKALLKQ